MPKITDMRSIEIVFSHEELVSLVRSTCGDIVAGLGFEADDEEIEVSLTRAMSGENYRATVRYRPKQTDATGETE